VHRYYVSSASFDRFPADGRLYRLIGTGRRHPAPLDEKTRRVTVYLAEMEELETGDTIYARHDDGSAKFLVLDEAAGSIPSLILGSFWRDKTIQKDDLQNWVHVRNAVLHKQTWQLTTIGATLGLSANSGNDPRRFPLSGTDAAGQHISVADMPVLHGYTAEGSSVYIPCYEIFRRFFGVTTELANALLGGRWDSEVGKLVNLETTRITEKGDFEIEPKLDLSDVACRAIALFQTSLHARLQTGEIHIKIANALRERNESPWFQALPPWGDQDMRISFLGEPLTDERVLALWIHDAQFPKLPYPITRLTPLIIPKSDPKASTGPLEPKQPLQPDGDDPPVIARPQDVRPIRRTLHISLQDTWSDLKPIRRRFTSERTVTQDPDKPQRKRRPPSKSVGTGKRSRWGKVPPGSFSGEEKAQIEDRFSALAQCFELMVREKLLLSFKHYGVVNPVEAPYTTYCALPTEIGEIERPWAMIGDRPRVCWVVELIRADEQRFYWLETESKGELHHRALILRMEGNATLPSPTLTQLLKAVVLNKGVWRPKNLVLNENAFTSCTVNHRYRGGMVKSSLVLDKMRSLADVRIP